MDNSGRKLYRILAVVGIGLLACAVKLWFDLQTSPAVVYMDNDTPASASMQIPDETAASPQLTPTPVILPSLSPAPAPETKKIPVYICGSVTKPGIYHVLPGSYLYEAIDMAAGLLPEAADEYMNLVFQFSEAVSIYIPSDEEMQEFLDGTSSASSDYLRNGLLQGIWGKSGGQSASSGDTSVSASPELVNINTADQSMLETLPGVGETTAKAIISYREKSGGFTKIEDIMNVAGIKEGRFEAIREFITV